MDLGKKTEENIVNNFTIALAGNPNCGKTSIFNNITGGKQQIGNWPGVTVERKEGKLALPQGEARVVDLPGIYSLVASSQDEQVARDFLMGGEVSLIVNVVDSSNLERNLYLTTQLLELNIPMVILLNMYDLSIQKGLDIDSCLMQRLLSVPVLPINAINKQDNQAIKDFFIEMPIKKGYKETLSLPNELEDFLNKWSSLVVDNDLYIDKKNALIRYLEGDESYLKSSLSENLTKQMNQEIKELESLLKDPSDVILADYRYGFINGICQKTVRIKKTVTSISAQIDGVVLNKYLGIPIFLVVMYMSFGFAMTLGNYFVSYFDRFFGWLFVDSLRGLLEGMSSPQWIISLVAEGMGAGLQTVATFVPVIFFMFFILSILEDSGYMARAAFITDRFMKSIGLPGKSFVPKLVGFGCTVPAIMATRTLEKKRDRYMTIFMVPFMSCGARFPVYAMLTASFFPQSSGLIVFSIYLLGIVLAILTGLLLKNSLFKGEISEFIMELPPYHQPRFKHIMLHTWRRLRDFIFRAGKVILLMVFILGFFNSLGIDGSFGNENNDKSLLTTVGKAVTPVFKPMGIEQNNWPATVGLFTGIFAKEAALGTMTSLYSQIEGQRIEETSINQLIQRYFNPWSAYAFMIFVLIYCPCLAALAAAFREMGAMMTLLMSVYLTSLAWIGATVFYQVAHGHDYKWVIISIFMLIFMVISLRSLGGWADKKVKQ
ncbi:MAG: ferrous iron transport protein B [Spirochaetaceae bacterium]|nr:ferrous iron transport protein B [Spirochaetaceae bacterium]